MRKFIPVMIMVLVFGLTGCRLSASQAPTSAEPTLSDVQVQTQISTLLTVQPTATQGLVKVGTATPALPTPEKGLPTATKAATKAAVAATATPAVTNTSAAPKPTSSSLSAAESSPTAPATITPTSASPAATTAPVATLSKDDPVARLGNSTSTDSMKDASKWVWPTGVNEFTSVSFANDILTMTSLKEKLGWRLSNPAGQAFSNLYLEATVKTGTCAANDQYGVIVRVPVLKDANQGYLIGFTCDGQYSVRLWDGKVGANGQMTRLIDWTANKAIHAGSNQTNKMGVLLVGGRIAVYANGVLLGETNNGSFSSGYFGLYVAGLKTPNFTIQVDEMSYWENPK
jgi:hypothetical protein